MDGNSHKRKYPKAKFNRKRSFNNNKHVRQKKQKGPMVDSIMTSETRMNNRNSMISYDPESRFDSEQCCSQVREVIFNGKFSADIEDVAALNEKREEDHNAKETDTINVDKAKNASSYRLLIDNKAPHKGWSLYFPLERFVDGDGRHKLIEISKNYLASVQEKYDADRILRKKFFHVNAPDFHNFCFNDSDISLDIKQQLFNIPDTVIKCMGLAMHSLISEHLDFKRLEKQANLSLEPTDIFPVINARFLDARNPQFIGSIDLSYYNKFVVVQGIVTKSVNIGPKCLHLSFECTCCHNVQTLILPEDGSYLSPDRCDDAECRGRTFRPLLAPPDIPLAWHPRTVDRCKVTLRDQSDLCHLSNSVTGDLVGELPILECELTEDLAHNCPVPGTFVVVSGILRLQTLVGDSKRREKNSYRLILFANSVRLNCEKRTNPCATQLNQEADKTDNWPVEHMKSSPNAFGHLIDSLCPHIYGYQFIKAGLLLALVGAGKELCENANASGLSTSSINFRDTIHVLIIGDPGLGKTHLLQACALASPRGVYLSGNTTTVAGLTVALGRESGSSMGNSGDVSIEAGALVMADGGCCCLDEFDKMSLRHHNALLEAMEQQQVSITKAGTYCQFPSRTSIVAAANPVGGRYFNDSDSTANQTSDGRASSTRIIRPLLNRFDLIFSLRDLCDAVRDNAVTKHLLVERNSEISNQDCDNRRILSSDELRRYISEAKKQPAPKVTAKVAQILLNYFKAKRLRCLKSPDYLPVGIRQFESLVRLTRARARCEFSPVCLERHAVDVLDIVQENGLDKSDTSQWTDDGNFDHTALSLSKKPEKRSKECHKILVNNLTRLVKLKGNALFTIDELKTLHNELFGASESVQFRPLLEELNELCYLLKKDTGVYQLLC